MIQGALDRGDKRSVRVFIGPGQTGGRHVPRAQLADGLLPNHRPVGDVVRIEGDAAHPGLLVMAANAVLVYDGSSGLASADTNRRNHGTNHPQTHSQYSPRDPSIIPRAAADEPGDDLIHQDRTKVLPVGAIMAD